MRSLLKRLGLKFWINSMLVVFGFGILMLACGLDNHCSEGKLYCSDNNECCDASYPYYCEAGTYKGKCATTLSTCTDTGGSGTAETCTEEDSYSK